MKVYMLYCYGEDGPQDVRVTTDKESVLKILESLLPDYERFEGYADRARKTLAELLDADKSNPESGMPLDSGWGGLKLQIVDLE